MTGRVALRWWPLLFAAAWVVFAVAATEPQPWGWTDAPHWIATSGAVLLAWVAFQPERMGLRVAATLTAITFPLWRFFALAFDPIPNLPTASRVVAMTAWALIALTLVILYPVTWFEGYKRDHSQESRGDAG